MKLNFDAFAVLMVELCFLAYAYFIEYLVTNGRAFSAVFSPTEIYKCEKVKK